MEGKTHHLEGFVDIMEPRRISGEFLLFTQKWEPTPVYRIGPKKTSPKQLKQLVLSSSRLQSQVFKISQREGVKYEQLLQRVREYLDEMGLKREIYVLRWLGFMVSKVIKRIFESVLVHEPNINKMIQNLGPNPVVFAPTHRSYFDFILVSFLCWHYNLETPVIATGMDFYNMWLVGELLRRSSGFFMRRSFISDELYRITFSEYVYNLVTHLENPIEFFIEGTRSRSGKALPPKYGLLWMVLEPFFLAEVPDVTIVPISISFDRVAEERLFAYEHLGVPKPKESTTGLFRSLSILDQNFGKVHINFAPSISVKSWLQSQQGDTSVNNFELLAEPSTLRKTTTKEAQYCRQLTQEIVQRQIHASVLSPFSLIATLLTSHLLEGGVSLPLGECIQDFVWLKNVLQSWGAIIDWIEDSSTEETITHSISIHKSLVKIMNESEIKLIGIHQAAHIPSNIFKGHSLSDPTMELAVPLIMLQFYVNPTIYLLASPALITLLLKYNNGLEMDKDVLFNKYRFLATIYADEFAIKTSNIFEEFNTSLENLELVNIVYSKENSLGLSNHHKLQKLLCQVMDPFIGGYLALSQILQENCFETPLQDRMIMKQTQQLVEYRLLEPNEEGATRFVRHPYSLSLDMYQTGLQAFVASGAVEKTRNSQDQFLYKSKEKLNLIKNELERLSMKIANPNPDNYVENPFTRQFLISQATIPSKL